MGAVALSGTIAFIGTSFIFLLAYFFLDYMESESKVMKSLFLFLSLVFILIGNGYQFYVLELEGIAGTNYDNIKNLFTANITIISSISILLIAYFFVVNIFGSVTALKDIILGAMRKT